MDIRALEDGEFEKFIDELWLPAQQEMATTSYYTLNEDIRDDGITHRSELLTDDEAATLLSLDGNQFTGYATLEVQTPPPIFRQDRACHVGELYVLEEYRRRGVASELLAETESWARLNQCDFLDLNVDKENQVAIDLYEQIGYAVDRFNMRKSIQD